MNVEDVPETITRSAYTALIATAGFDPNRVRSLSFRPEGIYAEITALGPDGHGLVDGAEVVVHRVFVRVED